MKLIRCKVCGKQSLAYGARSKTCIACQNSGVKYCSRCGAVKDIGNYSHRSYYPDELSTYCTACECERSSVSKKDKRSSNPAAVHAYDNAYCKEKYNSNEDYRQYVIRKATRNNRKRRVAVGQHSEQEWLEVVAYFNYSCAYCAAECNITRDHIIPVHNNGTDYIFNVVPACSRCNSSKGASDVVDWYTRQSFYSKEKLLKIYEWFKYAQKYL